MSLYRCYQPWLEMQIQYDKTVGCCCYYHGSKSTWDFEKNPQFNLLDYWNGQHLRRIREIVKINDARGTGCSGCQFVEYGIPELHEKPPTFMDRQQSENYLRAFGNFRKKKITVDSYPVRYYFNFGLLCNLRCVMCSQAEMRMGNKQTLPDGIFDDLVEYFKYAEQVAVIGGEPFVIPEARRFIQRFNTTPSLYNVRLAIFTNGILLHKFFHYFENIPKINFCISLDSSRKTYERIRRGAKWKRVESNIKEILARGRRMNHEWTVNIASVLMKSSLEGLVDYVQWCVENGLPCHFVPISQNALNRTEDIFSFPQLLRDIPHWQNILDDAIDILVKAGSVVGAADRLETMKSRLVESFRFYELNPNLFASTDTEISKVLSKINDEKFLVWGTGSYFLQHFSSFFQMYEGKNFLGFVDNDPAKWGHEFEGKGIYNPDKLKQLQPAMILIASAMRREIIEQIRELELPGCRVL